MDLPAPPNQIKNQQTNIVAMAMAHKRVPKTSQNALLVKRKKKNIKHNIFPSLPN